MNVSDTVAWLTELGSNAFIIYLVWHVVTKTIPEMQARFGTILKEQRKADQDFYAQMIDCQQQACRNRSEQERALLEAALGD